MNTTSRGFTLIELMVVVTIIAILAAIAIPAMLTALDKSKQRATMGDMRQIGQGVSLYSVDYSMFPTNGTSIATVVVIIEPFLNTVLRPQDHWSHDYGYASDGLTWYSLESFGRDGVDGLNITSATPLQFELDLVFASGRFTSAPL